MQVRWLRRALKNLDGEAADIARDDMEAAARMLERIASAVDQLAVIRPLVGRAACQALANLCC